MTNQRFVTVKVRKPHARDKYLKAYWEFRNRFGNSEYCVSSNIDQEETVIAELTEKGLLEFCMLLRYHHEEHTGDMVSFDDMEESDWLVNKCLSEPIYPQGFGYEFLYSYQPVTHAGCRVLLNYRRIVRGLEKMEGDLRTNY